jgi:glycosyltransferase involved in cell wall biosynthesis
MASVLYITYDGLLEPLGQSQVWQYLRRLSSGHRIVLVSFEKAEDMRDAARLKVQQDACAQARVTWLHLRYHKRPSVLATAYDVMVGMLRCMALVLRHKCNIVHARSYVPALIALPLKRFFGLRFVFDMRGFWADEKVDGGSWPRHSALYRLAKRLERSFFSNADVVISLTQAGVEVIRGFPYLRARLPRLEVIPTCVDLSVFRPQCGKQGAPRSATAFTLCYLGSVGPRYLFDDVLLCFKVLLHLRPAARLLIVNRGQHEYVRDRMRALAVPENAVSVTSATYETVAAEIAKANAGIFFYRPAFSTAGTAPTKLGEFLACGLPCLGNAGIGDYAAILEGERVGVVLGQVGEEQMKIALGRLLAMSEETNIGARCIQAAERHFSLAGGIARYDRIYRELTPV